MIYGVILGIQSGIINDFIKPEDYIMGILEE